MRILVVDDSVDTARMMAVLLKAEGHQVKTAFDGPDALQMALEFRPEVVLLDLTLPGMSGEAVAEELRRTEGFDGVAIVSLSGYDAEMTSRVFDHHFVKPVDHDALNEFLCGLVPPPILDDDSSDPTSALLVHSHPQS